MFNRIKNFLFPYKFKVGDIVTCNDYRCIGKKCQIDRIYTRGDNNINYVRIVFYVGYDKISFNIKASCCKLVV